jgi:hypothetical protein
MTETKTEALAVRSETSIVTRSETGVDKSEWGDGPWQGEPDLIEWTSEAPPHFWCQVARSDFGNLCGYCAVPAGHPAHGWSRSTSDARFDVHGGITWSGPGVGGLWVLGFDCGHGNMDVQPALDARMRDAMGRSQSDAMNAIDMGSDAFRVTYKDLAFVRAAVESLARQLAALTPQLTEGQP